ncbi:MAG: hypothetical protein KFF49_12855 [Bacteroidales bacterium]|nr:hypothetical protein [Bacteroidales bacterium]
MKKNLKFTALFTLIFTIVALTACDKLKKDEIDLLLDHVWNWNTLTTTSTNESVQDIVTLYNIFMTGATLEFHSDGTYTIKMLEEEDTGVWALINDNEVLNMDGDEMILIKLTKDELVLESEEVSNTYGTYNVTMYWKK